MPGAGDGAEGHLAGLIASPLHGDAPMTSRKKTKNKAQKAPQPQTWCVDVYEHEKGWGQRLEDRVEFASEAEALAYVQRVNLAFAQQGSDEHFALAHPPYKKTDQTGT
jgi:hypothetical protein